MPETFPGSGRQLELIPPVVVAPDHELAAVAGNTMIISLLPEMHCSGFTTYFECPVAGNRAGQETCGTVVCHSV